MYASRLLAFIFFPQFFLPGLSGSRTAFIAAHLFEQSWHGLQSAGRGHGARGLGCLKMLPLALLPWKRSPSRQANASCQALARGEDRWHFLLSVWA